MLFHELDGPLDGLCLLGFFKVIRLWPCRYQSIELVNQNRLVGVTKAFPRVGGLLVFRNEVVALSPTLQEVD